MKQTEPTFINNFGNNFWTCKAEKKNDVDTFHKKWKEERVKENRSRNKYREIRHGGNFLKKKAKKELEANEVNFVLENHYKERLTNLRKKLHYFVKTKYELCERDECMFIPKAVLSVLFYDK